jgi:hypothetical protein
MKKTKSIKSFFLVLLFAAGLSPNADAKDRPDIIEKMQDSIVYLEISYAGFEQYQPWKTKDITESWGIGCAIRENQVITTAYNVANVTAIRARRFGQNEFIPAKIKVVDYESNLALIELDPNALKKALTPLKFNSKYEKGAEVRFYWLSAAIEIYSGRGYLDRATVASASIAFSKTLNFVAANISDTTGMGQLFCIDGQPLGIACWSDSKESGIIPAETINRFLNDAKNGSYNGIGAVGFATTGLLDPALRKYLKLPPNVQDGVYISDVYTIGTGSDVLKTGDVLVAIDGFKINSYGRFLHPKYETLPFDCLITGKTAGEKIMFNIWRDGREEKIEAVVKNFDVSKMLVPYYDLDSQPEYFIIGGCILQKLTKTYLSARGTDWAGKTDPHIYNYLLNEAFKPADERKQIIVLSFVLPADITLGYHGLNQLVVDKINGMKIGLMKDIPKALASNPGKNYDEIEFELDQPKIVLDRSKLQSANLTIAKNYGIDKPANIK